MPNVCQNDYRQALAVSHKYCDHTYDINIGRAFNEILIEMCDNGVHASDQTRINLPARLRMSVLYALAQSLNGMVANTCNLSESYVGYDTLFGDQCGSFAPLADLTKTEIRQIAHYIGVPREIIDKDPTDGLSGRTDEEAFGFTYEQLDAYLRGNTAGIDRNVIANIEYKHKASAFKRKMVCVDKFVYAPLSVSKAEDDSWL